MKPIEFLANMWFEKIIESYHKEGKKFCMDEKDKFLNPIGSTYRESIGVILSEIFGGFSHERLIFAIENMVKIGCLYGYSFSKEKGYVSLLKNVIEEQKNAVGAHFEKEIEERLEGLRIYEEYAYNKVREKIESLKKGNVTVGRPYRWK